MLGGLVAQVVDEAGTLLGGFVTPATVDNMFQFDIINLVFAFSVGFYLKVKLLFSYPKMADA